MRTTAAVVCAAWITVSLVAVAAEVWETKPYTEWSDKDVEKVLTDSPWAGKARITHARDGAEQGPVPDWKLIISVRSALPYKQATLRRQVLQGTPVTAEQEAALAATEPAYVVAISGIPRMFAMQAGTIAGGAVLKRNGKEPVRPVQARIVQLDKDGKPVATPEPQRGGPPRGGPPPGVPSRGGPQRGGGDDGGGEGGGFGGRAGGGGGGFGGGGFPEDKSGITATLFLAFPKDASIDAKSGDIEVSAVIGTYAVSRKFKLKDMVFKGALEL
jgi:hypothetical protein